MIFASTVLVARIVAAQQGGRPRLQWATREGGLEAVEKAFAERGAPVQAEVSSLADPSVVRLLTGRGDVLQGFPAGGASLRLGEGIALLCGAATLPEHRRRGV